jgi:hypothetical protein
MGYRKLASWDNMNAEQFMEALCFKFTAIGCQCSPLKVAVYTAKWKTRNTVCDIQYALPESCYQHHSYSGEAYKKDIYSD